MLRTISLGKFFGLFLLCSCSVLGINKDEMREFKYIVPISSHGIKLFSEIDSFSTTNIKSKTIIETADSLLDVSPPTVTNKKITSPGGSFNDYVTKAPYWWPNPNTEDGYPYIQKDGEVNPETNNMDDERLNQFTNNLRLLTIAYLHSNNEKYAEKAIKMLKVWFIDNQTKMEPHLKYAQGIPGKNYGRPYGIIEGRKLIYVIDTFNILKDSNYWNKDIENNLYHWFHNYNNWLWDSDMGRYERRAPNNHGSWYDFQVAFISNALGNRSRLHEVLNNVSNRIDAQINRSGRQPLELERAKGLNYSIFNLIPLTYLAEIGSKLDYNFWRDSITLNNYNSAENSKLLAAIDFVVPFVFEKNQEINQQRNNTLNECQVAPILFSAFEYTKDDYYLQLYNDLIANKCDETNILPY